MARSYNETLHVTTDDTLRETVSHGDDRYPLAYYLENIWQFDFHCIDWHWHPELEFVSVTKGRVLCLVGEDKLELPMGCGLFVNRGVLHRYEALDNCLSPNIVFSPTLLAPEKSMIYEKYVLPVLHSAPTCCVFTPDIPWQKEILQILMTIYGLQEQTDKNELQTVQLLLKLWGILWQHLDLDSEAAALPRSGHRQARLQIMMQYIHDHYPEPITLEEIAASTSVSKSSALQLFRWGIHSSPVAYLIQYRLMRGAKLLGTTEKPVSAIAEETGFMSAGYFCRKFKERYRMSPNEYRREKK